MTAMAAANIHIDRLHYEVMFGEHAKLVEAATVEIKPLLGDIKEPAEIGRRLILVKEAVPGKFIYWIETFLEISVSQAENYMAAARVVKEFPKFGILARSAQYLLGAKGTPQEIKEEIAERLDRGEPVRYKDIHELHKGSRKPKVQKLKDNPHENSVAMAEILRDRLGDDLDTVLKLADNVDWNEVIRLLRLEL